MRPSILPVSAALALLSLSWALVAPSAASANQHAPIVSFGELIAPVEILAGRLSGGTQPGALKTVELHRVPGDRTLVITDIQVRGNGQGAYLLRDGERVAEASHAISPIGVTPELLAGRTASTAGIECGPGTTLALQMSPGSWTQFVSLRGYYRTIGPELVTIRVP